MKHLEIEVGLIDGVYGDLSQSTAAHNEYHESARLIKLLNLLKAGNYEEIIRDSDLSGILKISSCLRNDTKTIVEDVTKYLSSESQLYERELCLLVYSIAALGLVTQNNWCGPPTEEESSIFFSQNPENEASRNKLTHELCEGLRIDGEAIYTLTKFVPALLLAKTILMDCRHMFKSCKSCEWWLLRYIYINQTMMDERSTTFKKLCTDLIISIEQNFLSLIDKSNRSVFVKFYVEASHISHYYYDYQKGVDYLKSGQQLAQLEIGLIGIKGKRTKFQKDSISVLTLSVQRIGDSINVDNSPGINSELPQNVALNHEVLLDKPKFDEDPPVMPILTDFESALILHYGLSFKRNQGHSDMAKEELLAYVEGILEQPNNWNVMSHALFLRCMLEKDIMKKMERQFAQMELLAKQFTTTGDVTARNHLLITSQIPPNWKIEFELAHILLKIGSVKTALDVFLKLQRWDSVIECYQILGRREKAEETVREQLAIQETPELWCYLGDATSDCQYYEKAWEMSKHRCSRAQKMWGYRLFRENKYKECLEHFELALNLNPLQNVDVWFSYGCACMQSEEYIKGANAFRRFVALENDTYQGWNNLGACLVRAGEKPQAFKVFKESVKCNFDNWRLWENVLLIGTDVGEFEESIRAYHRLLDLERKHSDCEVLTVLVRAVKEDIPDSNNRNSGLLKPKLLELFGRITSKVTADSEIWRLYAELSDEGEKSSLENREKVLHLLQKSQRAMTQGDQWLDDIKQCQKVAYNSCELTKMYIKVAERIEQNTKKIQILSSSKLSMKNIITKMKKKHTDLQGELVADIVKPCESLDANYEKILQKINELQSS
ncbi:tetratricopeptide repeat protein 27-like [Tubulanus polymorphus]|uniref:tetratricopeptide repeat protein 27-like n=1 Tax=Tubulanus polymorphus TaxID=672921 RepID=UPI003DA46FA4